MAEAGWFTDESDPTLARWFDGERWTDHTLVIADWAGPGAPPPPVESEPTGWMPAARLDPPPPPPYIQPPPPPYVEKRTISTRYLGWPLWARIAAPAAAVLVLIAAVFGGDEDDKAGDLALSAESEVSISAPTVDDTELDAQRELDDAVATTTTEAHRITVPPTSTTRAPVVPPPTTRAPQPTQPPPTQPPATEPPQPSCHPSYSGCLDPGSSDYDCAGGSGNGPDYTGPVQVYGSDPFDLDRDGDGLGCEA